MTDAQRAAIAGILEAVAKDGLPGPRDLDVALDAIQAILEAPEEYEGERHVVADSHAQHESYGDAVR